MENKLAIGEKIRSFRNLRGLSQFELEDLIEASAGSISRIENNQVNPTKETLIKISQVLKLNRDEVGNLFGIDIQDNLKPILNANYEVFKSLDLDIVLQSSVNFIVEELNLFSCFVVLVEDGYIYARAATDNWATKLTKGILKRDINGIKTELSNQSPNLMVQSIMQGKPIHSEHLSQFLYPAISNNLALLLERLTGAKSCIAIPIELENKTIGAIMFSKKVTDSYLREMEALMQFCKHMALAINNAKQYEKLKEDIILLKKTFK